MALPSPEANGIPTGQQKPSSTEGEYNRLFFMVQQSLNKMQTSTLVRVESCTNSGGLSPVGLVDVIPMVGQVDGDGSITPHTTIFNIPYLRVQGGSNAIIIDPVAGDIGICVFASRDISQIKSTKKEGAPGSLRQYSFSDGMYLGGVLNGTPSQYVRFSSSGISMTSPSAITLTAPDIQLNADTVGITGSTSTTVTTPLFTVNGITALNGATSVNGALSQTGGGSASFSGSLSTTGDVTAQGTSLHTHVHGGVQSGGSNTGVPV